MAQTWSQSEPALVPPVPPVALPAEPPVALPAEPPVAEPADPPVPPPPVPPAAEPAAPPVPLVVSLLLQAETIARMHAKEKIVVFMFKTTSKCVGRSTAVSKEPFLPRPLAPRRHFCAHKDAPRPARPSGTPAFRCHCSSNFDPIAAMAASPTLP